MIIYKNNMSTVQNILLIIVAIALLVAGFFITIALLPFILLIVLYVFYKMRKVRNSFEERYKQTENYADNQTTRLIYKTSHSQDGQNSQDNDQNEQTVIYDISENDYTVNDTTEEKK